MTTPQSLTEEDLRLLESLPISLKELNEDDTDERIRPLHLLTRRGWIKYGGMEGAWGFHFTRTRLADDLLATLQAERERERERVNGLAALLADHTQDLTLSSPGQETPHWRAYGLPDYEDGVTGTTPIEAMENLAKVAE